MSPSSLSSPTSAPRAAASRTAPALWLVRHGQSTWNVAGRAQGCNDEAELTDAGLRQAAEVAEQFRGRAVRAIYASDLRRAQQTAAAIAGVLGLPVISDPRLRERSLGILEGRPNSSIGPSEFGYADGFVIDPDARPQAGESIRDLYLRAAAFCDGLAVGQGDVLAVAHGGPLRVMDAYIHGVAVDQMTWRPVDNATIVRIPGFGASRGEN